jgi:NAD(P)H-dependent flavin oxidoreductase YrpB (nitropropane dioxygenase family)
MQNPLSTALTERLGIAYPICQAGMGFIARTAAGRRDRYRA